MAFSKKTWKDRASEYPNRFNMTDEVGASSLVALTRANGAVSQEGDAFNATNMNDLENRIESAIDNISIDVLDTKEEIIANTDTGKVTGALATKGIIESLTANGAIDKYEVIDGYIYVTYKVGADSVRKKLCDSQGNFRCSGNYYNTGSGSHGKLICNIDLGETTYELSLDNAVPLPSGKYAWTQSRSGKCDTTNSYIEINGVKYTGNGSIELSTDGTFYVKQYWASSQSYSYTLDFHVES